MMRRDKPERKKEYFCVNVSQYSGDESYCVYRPSSLAFPQSYSVTFITKDHINSYGVFENTDHNLIFWPRDKRIPDELKNRSHVFVLCDNPHLEFCRFFESNGIDNYQKNEEVEIVKGAYISANAKIGKNVTIFPGVYISGDVEIGDNCYLAAGVKLVGYIYMGNDVTIKENTVIGADGLTTDRDEDGYVVKMPQMGGYQSETELLLEPIALSLGVP